MDGVTARVAGRSIGIPLHRLHRVLDAGEAQPFPLTAWPIEGVATVDALPVLQISLGGALGIAQPPGGKLVVIDTPSGRLAIRAETVTRDLPAGVTESDTLDRLISWPHPPDLLVPSRLATPWIDRRGRLPVLIATGGGTRLALPADSVQTIERIDGWSPQTTPDDAFLLRLGWRVVAARRLGPACPDGGPGIFALMPRDNAPVLTADHVERVRAVSYRDIHGVRLADGQMSWWIAEAPGATPIRLRRFDHLTAILKPGDNANQDAPRRRRTSPMPVALLVRCGAVRFTLPISGVANVLLPPDTGAARHRPRHAAGLFGQAATAPARFLLRLAGRRATVLGVDHVALIRLPDPTAWAPLPACPPAIAKRFQAMARIGDGWVLLSRRHGTLPGATSPSGA